MTTTGRPRVFWPGDDVPAGVCVISENRVPFYLDNTAECPHYWRATGLCGECSFAWPVEGILPLVEVVPPDYPAAVEADRARLLAAGTPALPDRDQCAPPINPASAPRN